MANKLREKPLHLSKVVECETTSVFEDDGCWKQRSRTVQVKDEGSTSQQLTNDERGWITVSDKSPFFFFCGTGSRMKKSDSDSRQKHYATNKSNDEVDNDARRQLRMWERRKEGGGGKVITVRMVVVGKVIAVESQAKWR